MSSQTNRQSSYALRTKRLALSAILAALAMIFSYIEALFPLPVPVPGIKVGLANLVIIIAIYRLGFKNAFLINLIRILTTGLLFTGLFGAIYSLSGGILSLMAMYLLYRTDKFSMVGVSMAGGVFHNVGQLIMAVVVLWSLSMVYYLPMLLIAGIVTGLLIGLAAREVLKRD